MECLEFVRQRLTQGDGTCVLWDRQRLLTADKVMGKGTAFLYQKLGGLAVHGLVIISRSASRVLETAVSAMDTLPGAFVAISWQYNYMNP